MAKVIIEIKDSKEDKEKSTVILKVQGMDKATETEKSTTGMIYNKVSEALKNLD